MSPLYKLLLELYASDEYIRKQLNITERHLNLIKEDKRLPKWLVIILIKQCNISPTFIFVGTKKKFLTLK